MALKLVDLNPRITDTGFLVFDCPACRRPDGPGDPHTIRVPLAPAVDVRGQSWKREGEFPDSLTLTPSIDAGCWHGFVTKGEIVP